MAAPARANQDRPGIGIVMMLGAYLFFAFVDTSVKWLVLAGLPAMQLAFMRYFSHFLLSLAVLLRGGVSIAQFATERAGLVILRAALLASATALNFVALGHISLTVASSIMNAAPIVVCLLSWPLLGERVGPMRWAAIVIGFAGVLTVIRPLGDGFHWAALLMCYNATALALYSILTRRLAGVVATETMQFYTGAVGTAALLPLALWSWQMPGSAPEWVMMILLGVWAWIGHELLTRAHGLAEAAALMPFTYSFLIYLTAASYLLFGDVPDRWTWMGAGMIIGSGLLIWHRTRRPGIATLRVETPR